MIGLFFLFRDGAWLGGRLLEHADRVFGEPGERLAERMVVVTRGTFNRPVAKVGDRSQAFEKA